MTTHTETARATRAVYAALWLPTASVVALVEAAAAAECLDPESAAWLKRVKRAKVGDARWMDGITEVVVAK